jgi:hypothetical protein
MSGLKFVNIHGQAIDPSSLPRETTSKAPRLKRVTNEAEAQLWLGFEVVGIREDALAAASAEHARKVEATPLNKRAGMPVFEPNSWLAKTKPKRCVSRVFYVPEAAEIAADMVRACGGWLRVKVVPILKG